MTKNETTDSLAREDDDANLTIWREIYAEARSEANIKVIVRRALDGYYWRVNKGEFNYGPLYNTASTEAEARAQAEAFISEGLKS